MFVNIDAVPVGQSLFTVAYTLDPVDTPDDQRTHEQIDVIAPSRSAIDHLLAETRDEVGEGRVVGVINQSDGFVVIESWAGITPAVRRCEWYALCENEGTILVEHTVLGKVPTCARCANKYDLIGGADHA